MSSQPQSPSETPVPPKKRVSRWFWIALVLPAVALDFSTLFTGKHYAVPADARAHQLERAGTWLAWSMVGLMVFLGLFIGCLVWRFRRLSRNPDPGLVLLDELYQDSLAEKAGRKSSGAPSGGSPPQQELANPPPPEWEKQDDWWRKP